jgi:50S ribosomal protein L16 3-hydroxylase
LKQHWQKKPLYLKQAWLNFEDPIQEDELAGLALEDFITSRVVLRDGASWRTEQGPFESYEAFGEQGWQLLVQAVNHWVPECQAIVEAFDFLPDWRVDDLMMSFCTQDGGVGPHIDDYDVFIIQGKGARRWQVGMNTAHQARPDSKDLALIEDFEPILDVTMQAGDMLYIPAGYPHQGQTPSGHALSYSLGFRAPLQRELVAHWGQYLEDNQVGKERFVSKDEASNCGIISESHQQLMQQMVKQSLQDSASFKDMLGQLLSQSAFELNAEPLAEAIDAATLQAWIQKDLTLHRVPGLKILTHEHDSPRVFINQEVYALEAHTQTLCYLLANLKSYPAVVLAELIESPLATELLIDLVNQGYLFLEDQ